MNDATETSAMPASDSSPSMPVRRAASVLRRWFDTQAQGDDGG